MRRIYLILFILVMGWIDLLYVSAQEGKSIKLDLISTVQIANSKSLAAFKAKNMYLANYWEYRTYQAERLPSLSLNMTPFRYYSDIISRYDSQKNIDVYRKQQSLYSSGNLAIEQNFDLTGGTFYVDTELGYFRSFGEKTTNQFSTVPIRIGYRQDLIGYNQFRWERRIAPVKFKRAQMELISELEETAVTASGYFFDLAMAQAKLELAKENLRNTDKLYKIGEEKHKIASIRQSELLTLELDRVNAKNSLLNARIDLKRSMFALAAYLNLDKNTNIKIRLPDFPKKIKLSVEKALMLVHQNNPLYLESKQRLLESRQRLDKTKKESMFNARFSASMGFNQVAETFKSAYRNPLQQDIVTLSLSIPLLDWGVRKGRCNMARNNLNVAELTAQQNENNLEEEVIITVGDFTVQQQMISSFEKAVQLAKVAYEQTQERFIIGKADINSLTLSSNRRQEAQQNFITSLKNYWQSYFKIRKLTLYDFEKGTSLAVDYNTIGK